jgi:arylsulfatase A-like enzyme
LIFFFIFIPSTKMQMNRTILPVSWISFSLLFFAGCGITVDKGPFPISEDPDLVVGKLQFLDSVASLPPLPEQPNILLIVADDLGKHDISTYDTEGVNVPHMDRLAREGIRFDAAYASSAVCSPSRVGLLTGRYQHRFGFERQPMNRYANNRLEYWVVERLIDTRPMQLIAPMHRPSKEEIRKQGIPEGEILLSELLDRRGYRTGIFGKWHLGHGESHLPLNRGFQEQFGFYEAFTYYAHPGTKGMVEHRHEYFASKHIWRQKRKGTCAIRENGKEITDPEYLSFSIARRAGEFMEKHRHEPFFLYLPFSAPHTPFQVPQEYYDRFSEEEDHNTRVYKAMIAALDDAIGAVIGKLSELGLEENTLVIFVSDNGGATYTGATDNGPLKAGKFAQFEGGVNVPMIMSWKGQLPVGSIIKEPVSLMDIYTTVAALSGTGLPGDREVDGMDLIPHLGEGNDPFPERALFWRTDFNKAVRKGNWKLIWNERDAQSFLYDLERDPGEKVNLGNKKPGQVEEMKALIREWEKEMKAPLWPGVMEFRFDLDTDTTLWAI